MGNISKEEYCKQYGMCKDKLYRYALYRLGNPEDAEDAVSDAVLSAWKQHGSLRSIEAFEAWLFSILRSACNAKIKMYIRDRDLQEKAADCFEAYSSPTASSELMEALAVLSDDDRDLVLMSVVGGFKSNELANVFGITDGTVRSRLSRSLAKMREFLSSEPERSIGKDG